MQMMHMVVRFTLLDQIISHSETLYGPSDGKHFQKNEWSSLIHIVHHETPARSRRLAVHPVDTW